MPAIWTLFPKAEKKKGKAFFLIMLGLLGKKINHPPIMMMAMSPNFVSSALDHL
jgi:hypothetical protein